MHPLWIQSHQQFFILQEHHGTMCMFTYLSRGNLRSNRLASQDAICALLTIIQSIGPVGFTCIIGDVIRLKQWLYQGLKSKSLHLLSSWTSKNPLMQATLATNNAPPLDSISSAIRYFARTSWYSAHVYISFKGQSKIKPPHKLAWNLWSAHNNPVDWTSMVYMHHWRCYHIEAMILPRLKIKEPTPPFILDK